METLMRLASALALVIALGACGDNLANPTCAQSGSRLKLARYEGGARERETEWY